MRTSFNTLSDQMDHTLNSLSTRLVQLTEQASSGQRIQVASDDPLAMQQVLDNQVSASQIKQYQSNITNLKAQASNAYSAISGLQTLANRASDIAASINGTTSAQDMQSYGTEISQLLQQAVQLANTKVGNNYLFGGTANTAPFLITSTDSSGNITGVQYQGSTEVNSVEIAQGSTISVLPVGANTTGTGASGLITNSSTGADFFAHLIQLQNDLKAGTGAGISQDLTNLTADGNNLTQQVAYNGVAQSRLTTANTVATNQLTALNTQTSQAADVDMATTITELSKTQTAYQAALQATALQLNKSLLDYVSIA